MNALQVIRLLNDPGYDYAINILDHQFENPVSWRLDFGRGTWIYLEWVSSCMVASSEIYLTDDEIYGFFKGKMPKFPIREALMDAAVKRLQVIIEEVKKEVSA